MIAAKTPANANSALCKCHSPFRDHFLRAEEPGRHHDPSSTLVILYRRMFPAIKIKNFNFTGHPFPNWILLTSKEDREQMFAAQRDGISKQRSVRFGERTANSQNLDAEMRSETDSGVLIPIWRIECSARAHEMTMETAPGILLQCRSAQTDGPLSALGVILEVQELSLNGGGIDSGKICRNAH